MTKDEVTNWGMDGIKETVSKRLVNLKDKTKEELIDDIIELNMAIYPFALVYSYLLDKESYGTYASSDLFPDSEWDFDTSINDLPDNFVLLSTSATYREFYDMGGNIEIQNLKYLYDVLYKDKNNTSEVKEQEIAPADNTRNIFNFKAYFKHILLLCTKWLISLKG